MALLVFLLLYCTESTRERRKQLVQAVETLSFMNLECDPDAAAAPPEAV